jgi:small subunit ribosomal protein S13
MARIEGVDLPRDKRVEIALTYIYGIGRPTSAVILANSGVDPNIRVKDLSEAELQALRDEISSLTVEGDRGLRHRRNLPVRGQRTRTNARTRRGPKKTVPGRGRRRGATKK